MEMNMNTSKNWFDFNKIVKSLNAYGIKYSFMDLIEQKRLDFILKELAYKVIENNSFLGSGVDRSSFTVCEGIVLKIGKELFIPYEDSDEYFYERNSSIEYYKDTISRMKNKIEDAKTEISFIKSKIEEEDFEETDVKSMKLKISDLAYEIERCEKNIEDYEEEIEERERLLEEAQENFDDFNGVYRDCFKEGNDFNYLNISSDQGWCELQLYEKLLKKDDGRLDYIAKIYCANSQCTIELVEECTDWIDEGDSIENNERYSFIEVNFNDAHGGNIMYNSEGKYVIVDLGMTD